MLRETRNQFWFHKILLRLAHYEDVFLAEHPSLAAPPDEPEMRINDLNEFLHAYIPWLHAEGKLTPEEYQVCTTYLRQRETLWHNHQQWEDLKAPESPPESEEDPWHNDPPWEDDY